MNNLSEIEKHEILKQLNMAVYKPLEKPFVMDYKLIKRFTDSTGFYAGVYQNLNNVVVVYRGTEIDDVNDLKDDLRMGLQQLPHQVQSALEAYDKVAEFCENNGYNLTVTGHSLGGSLAAIVSAERSVPAVTFNPYGVKEMLPLGVAYSEDKIINYRSENDPVPKINARNIIGRSYKVPSAQGLKSHYLENMGSLYERKEINYSETGINNFKSQLKDILSNVSNSISDFSNNAMNRILKDLHNLQSEMKENYLESERSIQDFIDDIDKDINKLDSAIMNYALSKGYDLPKQAKENLKKVKDITNSLSSKYSQKVIKGRISNKTYIWHSEPNACGVCAELDGTEYDNEWEIPAKPHPNCRCTIEEVIR